MKKKQIVGIMIIIFIIFIIFINVVSYGFSVENMTGKDLPGDTQTKIDNFGQGIIKVITTVGSICSVVVLIMLGIKYMMGSAEEKAEYKKTMIPYLVGAVLIFAGTTIVNVVYQVVTGLK